MGARPGRPLWDARHPALASDANLACARALLAGWQAPTPAQAEVRARILDFIDTHPADAHRRTCLAGHLTASALVVDERGEHMLLTLHRALGRWLQLGGHCDGDANLAAVAWREATEESGLAGLVIDPVPLDLDVHAIPARPAAGARPAEPGHLHLDTRFLVLAPAGARPVASSESLDLRWFPLAEPGVAEGDESVHRLVAAARDRLRG